jgi:predicted acetyltransferase
VSVFSADRLAPALRQALDLSDQEALLRLASVRPAVKTARLRVASVGPQLRYAHRDETAGLVAMARVDGLAELYDRLSAALGTPVEAPPAHVTLYSRPGPRGIGLMTTAELEQLSRPLTEDERQQLAREGVSTAALGAPKVEVVEATEDDRPVVRRLLQFYHYDFSEFNDDDVDPHGEFPHRYFDAYWTESNRKAFLFRMDGAWAGLALIFTGDPHDVAEFFVMRKYRRRGVGAEAAALLFDRFPGGWTVRQQLWNPAATAFWRNAIPYPFHEVVEPPDVVQSFTVPPLGHRSHWPRR